MKEQGVNVEQSATEKPEFEELIQSCKLAFNNFAENKRSLQRLIDEREEQAREKEDLEFQLERKIAELELLKKQVEKSNEGKLLKQIDQIGEEKKEMMNHFVI